MNSTPVCVVQDPRLMHKQLEDNEKYTFGLLQNEFMEACVKKKMVIATFYLTILTFFEFMPYNVSNLPDINS